MATVRISLDTHDGAYEVVLEWPEARNAKNWDSLVTEAVTRLQGAYGSKPGGV